MASKIKLLFPDIELQLVGPIGPKLSELFPQSIQIPEESRIEEDEVHLIMEYRVGEKWGDSTTTVATRFITSFDESNSKMTHLETFFSSQSGFEPDLIIISGLHLMEGEGKDFYSGRLKVFGAGLDQLNPTTPVHLELASMANGDLVQEVFREIIPEISSLGLNEQELSFSSHVLKGPHSDDFIHQTGQPEIHKISDMILWILKTFGYSKKRPESKLTRVHFHSLTYHILGTVPDAWSNNEAAVAAGTHMAGHQACDVKLLTPEHVELRIPSTFRLYSGGPEKQLDHNHPVIFWDYEGYHFVFSPVLVCKDPQKTVGLGDAISATGLMYSQYNRENLR
ncbi:hypothetical protein CHS0354_001280 [Potamilus streckersoni]|uniref:Uncharacterized protein n=1 Tax=Potamilus streckersoni TaxID=2493646 RepID=A0AAE0S7G0_9BIVA|nr:hypothetical protein CHS0354_001280 [Potamilus streckersoni]